jgi:hypothetical protein
VNFEPNHDFPITSRARDEVLVFRCHGFYCLNYRFAGTVTQGNNQDSTIVCLDRNGIIHRCFIRQHQSLIFFNDAKSVVLFEQATPLAQLFCVTGININGGIVTLTRLPRKNVRRSRLSRRLRHGIPPVHCFSSELAQCSS